MHPGSQRIFGVAILVVMMVITGVEVGASWKYGCCNHTDQCSGSMNCCPTPAGYDTCNWWYWDYCNPSCPVNLAGGESED